eukprot:TRINITY_DN3769_c0_g4_i1.p1 TRINITY_DN3769_c0_g4~~TRINITY_DN3769_c0_g4_i1.p1  ORF type:complete len:421 (-),score=92.07 TRINITY_DN3769_c0_g4_i1:389-1651(-)
MGLPMQLMPYAENLYRRFPEEFIALGMPGLEEAFDLRPNGTWSRRVLETPEEKTVEITVRRWPTPPMGCPSRPSHPQMYAGRGYGYATQYPPLAPSVPHPQANWDGGGYQYGGGYGQPPPILPPGAPSPSPYAPPGPPPPIGSSSLPYGAGVGSTPFMQALPSAPASSMDDQANGHLSRLESALASLKPQMEALLVAQAAKQMTPQAPAAQPLALPQVAAAPPAPQVQPTANTTMPFQPPQRAVPAASTPAAPVQSAPAPPPAPQAQAPLQLPTAALAGGQGNALAQAQAQAQANGADKAVERSKSPTGGRADVTMGGLDNNDLLKRRQMMQLQIKTTPKAKAEAKKNDVQVVKLNENDSEAPSEAPTANTNASAAAAVNAKAAAARQRASVTNISTARMPASAADPASPRSPGRYSVWN